MGYKFSFGALPLTSALFYPAKWHNGANFGALLPRSTPFNQAETEEDEGEKEEEEEEADDESRGKGRRKRQRQG